jgi:DNA-binding CsgD family transcriptional regulator
MTAYPIHDSNTRLSATAPQRFSPPSTSLTSDQVAHWRNYVADCSHPAVLFDGNGQVAMVNDPLRARISDPTTMQGTSQPTAFIWQSVCENAARIAVQQSKTDSATEISEAFPLHQKCFVAVGRILRNSAGYAVGSAIELVDLSDQKKHLGSLVMRPTQRTIDALNRAPTPDTDPTAEDSFQQWRERRETARLKMTKLSRREKQVVSLVADGLPNKSIAHELDISVKTIEKHRANATRKLGVGSTAQMVRIAVVADNKTANVGAAGISTDNGSTTLPLHHFPR